LPLLKKNLLSLSSFKNYEVIEKNIYKDDIFSKFNLKFDIIFLDPPYKDKNLDKLFIEIKKNELLNENGIIVIHRHKKDQLSIPLNFKLVEEKNYGISKILFLTYLN